MNRDLQILLQKIAIMVTATLLALMLVASVILFENGATISLTLGQQTYITEEVESDEEIDTNYYPSSFNSIKELHDAGNEKCEELIEEGAVLLKNDNNALPLTSGNRKVSIFSVTSVDPIYGGTGSGAVDASTAPTLKEAFERNNQFEVNDTLWDFYSNNKDKYKRSTGRSTTGFDTIAANINDAPWTDVVASAGSSFATYGDAAIFLLGRLGGEGADLELASTSDTVDYVDGDFLRLTEIEKSVLKGLAAEKGKSFKKIIVLINTANMLSCDFLQDDEYKIDAALWIGTPGQTGYFGVADLLAGNTSPSGRLADTIWMDNKLNPVNSNFGYYSYSGDIDSPIAKTSGGGIMGPVVIGDTTSSGKYMVYQEGIYVGYRYTETRYEDFVTGRAKTGNYDYAKTVAYPFGYGLSYTTFEYSNYKVEKTSHNIYTVSVDVKNTGDYAGKEVVQVYVQKPYIDGGIEKAAVELIGYEKTKLLAKNESVTVTVKVDERDFASYDADKEKTYVLDNGDYYLAVGNGSHDALNNILAAKGYSTSGGKMDYDGKSELAKKFEYHLSHEDSLEYSWAEATNKKITNLFDFVDINKYEGRGNNSVKYVTRSDWEGTVKTGVDENVQLTWTHQMGVDMEPNNDEEDDIEYPTYGKDAGLQLIDLLADENGDPIPYNDPLWDKFMDQLTWDEMVDMLKSDARMTRGIERVGKVATVDPNGPMGITNKYSQGPRGLAVQKDDPDKDTRATGYPAGGIRASSFNKQLNYEMGDLVGEDALWAGCSGIYGPGSNIHRSPYSGRNYEYYSEDPFLSGMTCAAEVKGMQDNGLYVYNKHCFLNDQDTARMGVCIWANEQAIREIYGRAFALPIVKAGAKNVMVGYNRLGVVWNGASKALLTDFLRGECGMTGFAITDMWYFQTDYYMSFVDMMRAGCDIVDGNASASSIAALNKFKEEKHSGEVAWGLRESAKRVCYTVLHSNAMNGISKNTRIIRITPPWQILVYCVDAVIGALFVASITWAVVSFVLHKKKTA